MPALPLSMRAMFLDPVRAVRPARASESTLPQRPASRSAPGLPPDPAVRVDLSPEALEALAEDAAREDELQELRGRLATARREADEEQWALREQRDIRTGRELSEADEANLKELQAADREVRGHEAAHLATAGGLAGGLQLQTVTGPDGRQYAVGGSVKIDMSDAGSPQANEAKMRKVKAAAMAVDNPSMDDLRVAGSAESQMQKARRARAAQRYEAQRGGTPS